MMILCLRVCPATFGLHRYNSECTEDCDLAKQGQETWRWTREFRMYVEAGEYNLLTKLKLGKEGHEDLRGDGMIVKRCGDKCILGPHIVEWLLGLEHQKLG